MIKTTCFNEFNFFLARRSSYQSIQSDDVIVAGSRPENQPFDTNEENGEQQVETPLLSSPLTSFVSDTRRTTPVVSQIEHKILWDVVLHRFSIIRVC